MFVKSRKITYIFSGMLIILSLFSISFFGFNLGIDFTGGSIMEIEYKNEVPPGMEKIKEALKEFQIGDLKIQPVGDNKYILRFKEVDEEKHQQILKKLSFNSPNFEEKRFDSIGPVIGRELQKRALTAIALAAAMIIIYIAFAFRKVSKSRIMTNINLSSFKYGIVAIIALLHDITIPSGIFSFLGKTQGVEIDSLFVTAILTILGFSVHDTIVVFDRIRENLTKSPNSKFDDTVNKSIKETLTRSINTSFTVLLVLTALFAFGGESTKFFSLALILGIFFGTYSSIFIASPLLVSWHNFSKKRVQIKK